MGKLRLKKKKKKEVLASWSSGHLLHQGLQLHTTLPKAVASLENLAIPNELLSLE